LLARGVPGITPELVNLIVKRMGVGMSREDAEKRRRALMEDSKCRELNKYVSKI
jgi:hypothetical protein